MRKLLKNYKMVSIIYIARANQNQVNFEIFFASGRFYARPELEYILFFL